jgi:alpha-tubulin suppressor-like RCC1 family protein
MPLIKNVVMGVSKQYSPQPIVLGQVGGGAFHSVYLNNSGKTFGWGANNLLQLGTNADPFIGSIPDETTPVSVCGTAKTFCKISAGYAHTIAVDKNGRAWSWGQNNYGQLGDNSITCRATPVSIRGAAKTFCQIAAGVDSHVLGIDKDGRVWAWGNNSRGQLGDNSQVSKRTPISVLGAVKTFCQISAGGQFSLAIDKNGKAWAWGYNLAGQLGDNTITSRFTPVAVLGATKTFCKIYAANNYSIAIDKNGRAWAWGINSGGQLGDNTTTSRRTPVSVAGVTKTFCHVSVGANHTVAIDKNGQAWGWGLNFTGQLGDNSTASRRTPVSVVGASKTFCQIALGYSHTIAIDKNGNVWAWGLNTDGQLGDNSTTSRLTPVRVCNI